MAMGVYDEFDWRRRHTESTGRSENVAESSNSDIRGAW